MIAVTTRFGCACCVIGTSKATLVPVACITRCDCTLSPSVVTTAHDSSRPVTSSKCAVSPTW